MTTPTYGVLVNEPSDAPDDAYAYVLDYDYLPEAGITHMRTWILRRYAPGAPASDVVDYVSLGDDLDRSAAEAWALKIIAFEDMP